MTEVSLSSAAKARPLQGPRDFNATGFSVRHVRIDGSDGFKYQWLGSTHYLALHDLQLADGEIFSESSAAVEPRKDLRGLMTFAPAGCRVWGWSVPRSVGQSFTALYFSPRQPEKEVAAKLRHTPSQASIYFSNKALRSTLEKIQWASTGAVPVDPLYMESLCLVAMLEVCVVERAVLASIRSPAGRLSKSNEQRIVDYVEANLCDDIGLDDLAQLAGLSRFHFMRAFKKTTDQSPYQYLLSRRVERAKALLEDKQISINEVAAAVGFKSSAHFIRTFRKAVGVTPGAYQE
jgi:AraC family transcriptional regulator